MSSGAKNYYATLEIPRTATQVDIKKAYKLLARKWHPDKNLGNHVEAERKFKEITEAYQVLSNQSNKHTYDYSTNEDSAASSSFDFDATHYQFKTADELFREFFGDKTAQESLEDFINDPVFTALGLETVPSSRDQRSSRSRRGEQHPTDNPEQQQQQQQKDGWLPWFLGWFKRE